MSRVDPECFPVDRADIDDTRVCSLCFEDDDLQRFVGRYGRVEECEFCGRTDQLTMPLEGVVDFIEERIGTFYGRAVDQLPYDGRDGGYLGNTYETSDLLFGGIGLPLNDDVEADLLGAIEDRLSDELWCDYDFVALDLDESLAYSWKEFCEVIKHRRRFFFTGLKPEEWAGPDDRTPAAFLADLADMLEKLDLVVRIPEGTVLFRARPRENGTKYQTAAELGPPPPELALQANRMNPPGIPMFYGAESADLAVAEVRNPSASIGEFSALRDLRVLDLVNLPEVPGFFSEESRRRVLYLRFLHEFASAISQPVPRDDRVHVDYLPSQVVTEFLRDLELAGAAVDGLRYPSAVAGGGNLVLFASPERVQGATDFDDDDCLLALTSVEHR